MSDMVHTEDASEIIEQDEVRGPGWFLKLSYVVIIAFCIYYLFAEWDWKSDYDEQQEQIAATAVEDTP